MSSAGSPEPPSAGAEPPVSLPAPESDLRIVLVRPEESRNVGAACRAAKTMGIEKLYLVAAEAVDWREARIISVHAADVLERAVICRSVAEAVHDCTLAAAVTRRDGKHRKYRIWTAEQLGQRLAARRPGPVALVFGNEKERAFGCGDGAVPGSGSHSLVTPVPVAEPVARGAGGGLRGVQAQPRGTAGAPAPALRGRRARGTHGRAADPMPSPRWGSSAPPARAACSGSSPTSSPAPTW